MSLQPSLDFDLVPIRLDIFSGSVQFRDAFCWNRRSEVSPLQFAQATCRDLLLPMHVADIMAASISEQLSAHSVPALTQEQLSQDSELGLLNIKIDIIHNGVHITDAFSWNPYTPMSGNTVEGGLPEMFASQMVIDLGLDSSTAVAIAIEIREQLWNHFLAISNGLESPISRVSASSNAVNGALKVEQVLATVLR